MSVAAPHAILARVPTGSALEVPRVLFGAGRVLYVGPALDLRPHRNVTATVALALGSAPFRLSLGGAALRTTRAAFIPPGTHHHLHAEGPMAFAYLDGLRDGLAAPSDALLAALPRKALEPRALLEALSRCLGARSTPAASPRLRRTIQALDACPERFPRVEIAAAEAGLSVSRFQHVFREVTGVPFRRYRLWRRMGVVARALTAGRTLTEAAHEAGFASSAHFSESFRLMFGLAPSTLLRRGLRIELDGDLT